MTLPASATTPANAWCRSTACDPLDAVDPADPTSPASPSSCRNLPRAATLPAVGGSWLLADPPNVLVGASSLESGSRGAS